METVKYAYSVIEALRTFCRFWKLIDQTAFSTYVLPDSLASTVISTLNQTCGVMEQLENSDIGGFFQVENDGTSGKEDISGSVPN